MTEYARLTLELYDQHPASPLRETDLTLLLEKLNACLPKFAHIPAGPDHVLSALDIVEITLVDDPAIATVHQDFMNIPGATDVITFHHGEIIISLDTTAQQAQTHDQPFKTELLRYMIHGLLHLHGFLDYTPEERDAMFIHQEHLLLEALQD